MVEKVIVTEVVNDVIVSSPGPQGPRGRTILNGTGVPSNNLGLEGDFYYDKSLSKFYFQVRISAFPIDHVTYPPIQHVLSVLYLQTYLPFGQLGILR